MDTFLNWFEEHKIGVIGTLAVHSALLFVFLLSNLRSIPREDERSDMRIEIVDSEEAEELIEEMEHEELAATDRKVTNLTSNITAERTMRSYSPQRLAQQVEEEVRRMEQEEFDRLQEERRERGEEITIPELDPSKWNKEKYMDEKPEPVRIEGLALVEFNLEDRVDQYLHRPGFQCLTGGIVQVNVTVDPSGRVIRAEMDPRTSTTTDECLIEKAINSAKTARFNDRAGGDQSGWIKYTFMEQ